MKGGECDIRSFWALDQAHIKDQSPYKKKLKMERRLPMGVLLSDESRTKKSPKTTRVLGPSINKPPPPLRASTVIVELDFFSFLYGSNGILFSCSLEIEGRRGHRSSGKVSIFFLLPLFFLLMTLDPHRPSKLSKNP